MVVLKHGFFHYVPFYFPPPFPSFSSVITGGRNVEGSVLEEASPGQRQKCLMILVETRVLTPQKNKEKGFSVMG
jgi:hypothetical protein